MEKLRDRYRERDWDEMQGRFADTSHCVREEGEISSRRKNSRDDDDSGNSTEDSGMQQIKADSITIGGMSEAGFQIDAFRSASDWLSKGSDLIG